MTNDLDFDHAQQETLQRKITKTKQVKDKNTASRLLQGKALLRDLQESAKLVENALTSVTESQNSKQKSKTENKLKKQITILNALLEENPVTQARLAKIANSPQSSTDAVANAQDLAQEIQEFTDKIQEQFKDHLWPIKTPTFVNQPTTNMTAIPG